MRTPDRVIDLRKVTLFVILLCSLIAVGIDYLPDGKAFSVTSVAVSSDGEKLVSGYIDNTVKVWSLLDGRLLNNLLLNSAWVTSVAVSPDGKMGIAGYDDGMIIVWDLKTGNKIKVLSSHTSAVNDLIVTDDSKTLYSCSSDATVKVWSLSSLSFIRTLRGHSGPVHSIVDWPEQNRLYSASEDGTLRIWDTSTGQQVKVIRAEVGSLTAVSMDRERTILILGSEAGHLKSYDVKTWSPLKTSRAHNARVTKILVEDAVVYTASCDRTIKLLSLPSLSLVNMITGHNWDVTEIVLSSDGYALYSSSTDGTIKIWDIEKGSAIGTLIGFGDGEYFSYNALGNWVSSSKALDRVSTNEGAKPSEVAKEINSLLLQLDKLPKIYGPSIQNITIEEAFVGFSVSQSVTQVTVNGEQVVIGADREVVFEPDGAGDYIIRAYDSSGLYDERTLTVRFEEVVMYVVKDIGVYQRGDRVIIDDSRETAFLVNGEWLDKDSFSRSAPDVEPPLVEGEGVQRVSLGETKYLEFSVSDNATVTTVEIVSPDLTVSTLEVNSASEEIKTEVQGTGVYTVYAFDCEGNKSAATFAIEAEPRRFWVSEDHESLRQGQEVQATEEGESCYFVTGYGWLEKMYLSVNPVSTGYPDIYGDPVQFAASDNERILTFTVRDDVNVKEVVVSGKAYPVNEREREMHIIVNGYGEYIVTVNDVEGNSTQEIFTLMAPPEDKKASITSWAWLIPVLAITMGFLLKITHSSKKKRRKVRL